MLISNDLSVSKPDSFRIHFLSNPVKDILAVDILISPSPASKGPQDMLRICTTNYIHAEEETDSPRGPNEHTLAQKVYHGNPSRNRNFVAAIMLSNEVATEQPGHRPLTEYEAQFQAALATGSEAPPISEKFLNQHVPNDSDRRYHSQVLRGSGSSRL